MDKVMRMKRKAEQKYKRFEETQLKHAKRELVAWNDVLAECTGYLRALNDMELLTEDFGEALNNMICRVIKEQAKSFI